MKPFIYDENELEVAVIGMSARFTKFNDLHAFWEGLRTGEEGITFFEKEASRPETYIPAYGFLNDKEAFDADFFGYSKREAEIMDPQMRAMHQGVWHALEDAGYTPGLEHEQRTGLFLCATANPHWEYLYFNSPQYEGFGSFAGSQLVDKDYMATRIAYSLNLQGPTLVLSSACSSSLVAIHMAAQSLLNGECDLAVAGGVNIGNLKNEGYHFEEGMINSPDGHCKPFAHDSHGTVGGEGMGVVVLRRYQESHESQDNIHAVIKGSAVNNDGNDKVGYTAPSVNGQSTCIRLAHLSSEVTPESIAFVETHGTATKLGDPIEIQSLQKAFENTPADFKCPIGGVKSNLGHLDAAAGVAGFIKAVLSLEHQALPPSLHFTKPNPDLKIEKTQFYVNNQLLDISRVDQPLRAGVSSFGIGGTNAHIVLERYNLPEQNPTEDQTLFFPLSAKTQSALNEGQKALADYLLSHQNVALADIAYTLQQNRETFANRMCFEAKTRIELIEKLNKGTCVTYPSVAQEWANGSRVTWPLPNDRFRKVSLPGYSFEKGSFDYHDLKPQENTMNANPVEKNVQDWFFTPTWKLASNLAKVQDHRQTLTFLDENDPFQKDLLIQLKIRTNLINVGKGIASDLSDLGKLSVNPKSKQDYLDLLHVLNEEGKFPEVIVFTPIKVDTPDFDSALNHYFFDVSFLAQAIATFKRSVKLVVLGRNTFNVLQNESIDPFMSFMQGPSKLIAMEYEDIKTQFIDLNDELSDASGLVDEINNNVFHPLVAYRLNNKWIPSFNEAQGRLEINDNTTQLMSGGTYLLIGGLGGVGLNMARYFEKVQNAHIILTGRTELPAREHWDDFLDREESPNHEEGEESALYREALISKLTQLRQLEAANISYELSYFDVADPAEVQRAIDDILSTNQKIDGVIYLTATSDDSTIQSVNEELSTEFFTPKIMGLTHVMNALQNVSLDFTMLTSALGSFIPAVGQVHYCVSNLYIDAYANHLKQEYPEKNITAVNWDRWNGVGMAKKAERQHQLIHNETLTGGFNVNEGLESLEYLFQLLDQPQVVISTQMSDEYFGQLVNITTADRAESNTPAVKIDFLRTDLEPVFFEEFGMFFDEPELNKDQNFFELGVTSLAIVIINGKIKKRLDLNIELTDYYTYPTIESLIGSFVQNEATETPVVASSPGQVNNKLMMLKNRTSRSSS